MSSINRKSNKALFEALESRTLYSVSGGHQIIGYLPDYQFSSFISVNSSKAVSSDTVAWQNLTQINYFSLEPNANGSLQSTTSSGYTYSLQLPQLIKEASNHGVAVNVTIGGGDAGSISDMTALVRGGQTAWTAFAGSVKSMIATASTGISNIPAGGVGIDLDWEPTDGTVSTTDVANYGKLIQTIHQDDPAIRLSAAVLAGKQSFTNSSVQSYVLSPTAVQNLTNINVMDYELDAQQAPVSEAEGYMSAWASFVTSTKDPITGVAVGGHKSQLNFGVPFYGVGNNGSSFVTYPQILAGTRVSTTADYIVTNVNGTSYYSDSPATLKTKVDYALSNGFNGVMAWELGQDVLPESSSTSLLSAVKSAVSSYGGTTTTPTTGTVSGTVKTSFGAAMTGVTVYLDTNNNDKLDTGELKTTTAATTGAFTFSNVPVHAYTVRQVLATGDTQTSPASNAGHAISVTAGGNLTNENFTDTIPTGTVSGTVKNTAGKGLTGVTVYLDANANAKFDTGELTAVTNSAGAFTFSNVPVRAYTVREVLPTGDTQTSPTGNGGHAITVAKGSNLTGENFIDSVPTTPTSAKLSGTIIAAAVSNNSTTKYAFDGNLSTDFHASAASGNWLGLDLGVTRTLTQIKFASAASDPWNMEGGTFQASNSATFASVVNLYTIPNTAAPSSTALTTINLSITTKYRYVRFVPPAASFGDLSEIEFFGY